MVRQQKQQTVERYDVMELFIEGGRVTFKQTKETVFAITDEDALALAKQLGLVAPILMKVRNTHEIVV